MSAWDRAEDAADIPWWHKVLVALAYLAAGNVVYWIIARLERVTTWPAALNSSYAYMTVTIAVAILAERLVPKGVAISLTAISLGLWLGAKDGFWPGVAYVAAFSVLLTAASFVTETALRLWRVRHAVVDRVRGRR